MARLIEPSRGGFRGRLTVWEAVSNSLSRGPVTMVDLHREYKTQLREAYAEEWRLFEDGKQPYRVVGGRRGYLKHPPRGMTYLSFVRYINRFVNEGLLEKMPPDAREAERFVADELLEIIKEPVYYQLK